MISDDVDRIGCAAIEYQDKLDHHKFHFTCNYNTYAVYSSLPYYKGPVGNKCEYGSHSKYEGLCAKTPQRNPFVVLPTASWRDYE